MNRYQGKPITIYVVDDDPGHARLVEKKLLRIGVGNAIEIFPGGAEILKRVKSDGDLDHPILVLLDLNMPGISGQRVLKMLKNDEHTRHIPVFVLTSSDDLADSQECYSLGCDAFLTKPMKFEAFAENLRHMGLTFQILTPPNGIESRAVGSHD